MKRSALLFTMLLCCATAASSDSPKRPRIFGLVRVSILSTDVPQSLTFYAKTLGINQEACEWCEKIPAPVFFLNPNQILELSPSTAPAPDNMILSIAFQTDNVRELRRYLEAHQIHVNNVDRSNSASAKILSFNDPEAHHIIFIQNPLTPPIPQPGSLSSAAPVSALHIIHAGFIVRDRAATEHFYKDILGFRPYWHGGMKDDQTDWVSMQVPDGTDWLEFMVNVEPDADQRLRGIMNHIAIGVPDIHATQKKLIENGAKLTEEPQIGRDGKWQLNLYDPDETRIEFMEFTPVQKPCCSEFTGPHPGPQPPSKAPAKP